ncbi:MAG: PmeII family type II restriction endonuclease [Candidatus Sumerlaeota bacterium]
MEMKPEYYSHIRDYVEACLPEFHQIRISKLENLDLMDVLKRKNPYLFKVKNISTANEFIETILNAYLSSQEETLFGGFLEGLAIYLCETAFNGKKSASEGIDLEFENDSIRYIVSIKSGPNWGNSSQIKKMKDNFRRAKRILGTNRRETQRVVAVNGCCYGRDSSPEKDEYLKLCGQRFWEFVSGYPTLYVDIIEPLGHEAKKKNEEFMLEYSKVVNRFSKDFLDKFCDDQGNIRWDAVVKYNSSIEKFVP